MEIKEVLYTLYVGSNNVTKELEKDKIISIMNQWYPSFSAQEVTGYWQGQKENTLKIEIFTNGGDVNEYSINSIVRELEKELKQDKVLKVEQFIKTNFE